VPREADAREGLTRLQLSKFISVWHVSSYHFVDAAVLTSLDSLSHRGSAVLGERRCGVDVAGPTAGGGDGELDVGGCFLVVVFLSVLALQTVNFLLEEQLGLNGGTQDATVAGTIGLATRIIL
jgi:hypothetical protein